jgi:hypothetical protein
MFLLTAGTRMGARGSFWSSLIGAWPKAGRRVMMGVMTKSEQVFAEGVG